MNGIIGMTGLLLETNLSAEQRRYAEALQDSGESLLSLVNNILDLSKIEEGKLVLENLGFDVAALLKTSSAPIKVLASQKGLNLSLCVDPQVPTFLRGDPGRLSQILTNLTGKHIS